MHKLFVCLLVILQTWTISDSRKLIGRIIGGIPARAAQFPFAAGINKNTNNGNYFCAGTLIGSQWILSAGQCVNEALLFTIHLGSTSLSSNEATKLSTDTYVLHPQFNGDNLSNDIGLIKLRIPIIYTEYIRAIMIMAGTTLPDFARVLTFGWGQTNDNQAGLVDQMQYVYLTTLSNAECKIVFGSQITDEMVCVAGDFNEGTCWGDSGSPLLQYSSSDHAYHVGVSSFFSANGCESPDPSGYTRTSVFRDWIHNVTLL